MSNWNQIELHEALQAFLKGRVVKVVDLSADVIMPLAEVLERFQQGAVMYMDGEVEAKVESDPEKLNQEIEELRDKLQRLTEEYGDLSTRYAELDAAYQIAKHPAPPALTEPYTPVTGTEVVTGPPSISVTVEDSPAKPKRKDEKVQLAEMEEKVRKRKIKDYGKLRALKTAGWSNEKIADEFGCSSQTVANTLKRLEEQEAQA